MFRASLYQGGNFQPFLELLNNEENFYVRDLSMKAERNIDEVLNQLIQACRGFCQIERLQNWMTSWRFNSNDVTFRSLILYAMHRFNPQQEGLGFDRKFCQTMQDNTPIKSWDLDHFEPVVVPSGTEQCYFNDDERIDIINGVGNIVPLFDTNNRRKSNRPAKVLFTKEYSGDIPKHWFYDQLKTHFEENSDDNGVPKRKFFTVRKDYLIDLFSKILQVEF